MNKIERTTNFLAAVATILSLVVVVLINRPEIESTINGWLSKFKTNHAVGDNINSEVRQDKITQADNSASLIAQPGAEETNRQTVAHQLATTTSSTARQYKVGGIIKFGSYPFHADGSKEDIDWKILDIDEEDNALVISDYALDNVRYNEEDAKITWEESTIREWLNKTFIKEAFTKEQKKKIIGSLIENKDNAKYSTRGGNDTDDRLFLLSIEEATKYFMNDEARIAYPTPYAKNLERYYRAADEVRKEYPTPNDKSKNSVNGKLHVSNEHVGSDRGGSCMWWLRSPGNRQWIAAYVQTNGVVAFGGYGVRVGIIAVRPAFRINLNNL